MERWLNLAFFRIRSPIWKNRSVGINDAHLTPGGNNEIEILYEDKNGNRVYPHIYQITTARAKIYPVQHIKGSILRIIPIKDLHIKVTPEDINEAIKELRQ